MVPTASRGAFGPLSDRMFKHMDCGLSIFLVLGLACTLLGVFLYPLWNPWTLTWVSTVLAALVLAILAFTDRTRIFVGRRALTRIIAGAAILSFSLLLLSAAFFGYASVINGILDGSRLQEASLLVRAVYSDTVWFSPTGRAASVGRVSGGNRPVLGYFAVVDDFTSAGNTVTKRVSSSTFQKIQGGSNYLNIKYRNGFLGFTWVEKFQWSDNKTM
jgi:hypothetical protein